MGDQRGRDRRPVGIRDVAAAAGVSVASASVAINGRSGVSEQTRQRVLKAAQRLGYRANPQAQALRRGRTSTYGLIVRNFSNPFFIDVISGAEEVAAEAGATLLVVDSQYSLERERRHVAAMADRQCAGLAIAPVGPGDALAQWQNLRPGLPAVALNATADQIPGVVRVCPDNVEAVGLPMRRLAEFGHVRVGFLAAPRGLLADPDRLREFRRQARRLGLRGRVLHSPLTIDGVRNAVLAALSRPDPPTAVITNSDYTAHAVYLAARMLSLPVGSGVSVVGHDDLPTSELLDPPLTTLQVDRRAMGRALMLRLLDPAITADHVEPVHWIERASVGRPSSSDPSPESFRTPSTIRSSVGRERLSRGSTTEATSR
ncbi:MAG TPA: LacI family DNA-binding transcriptional regulator [Kineosporiaceae bacterium]|nr:LacI family DNA-binding transcriptional regulator [Kineosporiaceae bacterium]